MIRQVARTFGGVEHRIEFVRELDGVRWYNDSIATSPTRAIAGLNAFDQKIIILAGGYDKKIPFEPLAPVIVEKVKAADPHWGHRRQDRGGGPDLSGV